MRRVLPLFAAFTLAACASGPPSGPLGPGSSFRDCPACPEMVVIPAGQFQMGSPPDEADRGDDEGPVRTVSISQPFAIGKYEVTQGEFAAFVEDTGYWTNDRCLVFNGERLAFDDTKSWQDPGYPVTDDHPMVCVSWWDAANYTEWLSEKTGHSYSLPPEAKWEYAVRGGTQSTYSFPGGRENVCAYGNVSDLSAEKVAPTWDIVPCDDSVGMGTAPVGSYRPNGFGLHDTIGNVWEWMADCYQESFENAPTNGSAWGNGGKCSTVLDRGGGFSTGYMRAANRSRAPSPHIAVYSLGFRVMRDLQLSETGL